MADETAQVLADRRVEPEATDRLADLGLLLLGDHVEAAEVLGLLCGGLLGEVDDVDRCPVRVDQLRDGLVKGVSRYSKVSGTGRSLPATVTVGLPVRPVRSSSNLVVGPRVADMRRNCVSVSSSSGTCHAQPR